MRHVMMYRYKRKEEAIKCKTVTNKLAIYVSFIQCCMVTPKIKLAGTNLYTWAKRVKCLGRIQSTADSTVQ